MAQCEEIEVDVPWGKVRGRAWNSPAGKPVLCIHGACRSADSFLPMIPHLSKNLFVVAIDLPGNGLSDYLPPTMPYTNATFHVATLATIKHYQWKSVALVGHCFGAIVALQVSLMYPDLVNAVISLDHLGLFSQTLLQKIGTTQPWSKYPSSAALVRHYLDGYMEYMVSPKRHAKEYTKEESIQWMVDAAFENLPKVAAANLFDRCFKSVGHGKYVVRRDPRTAPNRMVFDYRFLCQESELNLQLAKCPWKYLIIRAAEGFHETLHIYETELPWVKRVFKDKLETTIVPGSHQNHMITPEHPAKHINAFLGEMQSKL